MVTPRDLLNAAKAEIREVEAADVASNLDRYTMLDVREPDEYDQGAVPNAAHALGGPAQSLPASPASARSR